MVVFFKYCFPKKSNFTNILHSYDIRMDHALFFSGENSRFRLFLEKFQLF